MTLLRWLRHRFVFSALALAATTGCGTDLTTFANRFTSPAERAFPRSYLQLLADSQFDSALSLLAPELRADTTRRVMRQVAVLLRDARLDSMRLIGVNAGTFGAGTRDVNLTYEMPTRAPGRWVMSNVAARRTGPAVSVIGFSAYPIDGPLEVLNRFTVARKTPIHYVWLVFALVMPVATITVAIIVARARGMPRRWLWASASLVATPTFFINWTTGAVGMQGMSFLLFGGAATSAGPAAPWIVSFALPVGAGVAYLKLRQWRQSTHAGPGAGGAEVAA